MYNLSLFNQNFTADDTFLNIESSITGFNDKFDKENNDIFSSLLDTKANNGSNSKKSKKQISKFNIAK